jgi:phytoene synthase
MMQSAGVAESRADLVSLEARARGSSFYAGMRLMPKPERDAMFAIYAFSRAVDDIADDGARARDARAAELESWRTDIEALYAGSLRPRTAFLSTAVERYGLRKEDFLTLIDGMAMDVAEDIRGPDLAMLDLYCDRVASAVGRLSIKVFDMDEGPGFALAHHLGRALQLTNILRDIDEDAAVGRLYLPHEMLAEAGIESRDPMAAVAHPAIDHACRSLARRTHEHYRAAADVMRARPRGFLRTPRLMGEVYRRILVRMEQVGWSVPRKRVRIGRASLILIMLRYGLIG